MIQKALRNNSFTISVIVAFIVIFTITEGKLKIEISNTPWIKNNS